MTTEFSKSELKLRKYFSILNRANSTGYIEGGLMYPVSTIFE